MTGVVTGEAVSGEGVTGVVVVDAALRVVAVAVVGSASCSVSPGVGFVVVELVLAPSLASLLALAICLQLVRKSVIMALTLKLPARQL